MNPSGELNTLRMHLQEEITNALKNRISSLGLIASGTMHKETEAQVQFSPDGLDIKVRSTDYYEYLDADNDITNYVLESHKISLLIEDLFGLYIVEYLLQD